MRNPPAPGPRQRGFDAGCWSGTGGAGAVPGDLQPLSPRASPGSCRAPPPALVTSPARSRVIGSLEIPAALPCEDKSLSDQLA